MLLGQMLLGLVLLGAACVPPTPAQKASDAARELNMAARWGRMDEAMNRAAPPDRAEFMKKRAGWHGDVRIVETELAGMNMLDATHATVQVDVSWTFADDPTLRVTRLSQDWSDADGKWVMVAEEQISGEVGLFGEEVARVPTQPNKHFPSRTIR